MAAPQVGASPQAMDSSEFGETLSSKLAAIQAGPPSESESDNESFSGSERSFWPTPAQKLKDRFKFNRPCREAKLVFAEEVQTQTQSGTPQHMGLGDMRALIQKEQRKLKEEVTAMPYENTDMFDGDNSENEAFLGGAGGDAALMKEKLFQRRPAWIKWALTALIGIVVSAQCAAMHQTEIMIADVKQGLAQDLYNRGLGFVAVALALCYGLVAATLSAFFVVYVSPRAASSGIPDTKAFLNGNRIPGFLSFKTWFARTVALMLVTSAGLFAGSEGPLLAHLGSIISSGLARGRFEIQGMRIRLPWKFCGHRVQAEFVSIGTAMGVAGAFGSPVGGLLFSMEEQSSFWSLELTWRTFFGCTIAALFAKAAKNGFQSFPLVAFVDFPDTTANFKPWELAGFALIGLLTGLAGALFCKCSFIIGKKRQTIFTKAKPRHLLRFAELWGLTTAIILVCFLTPQLLGCRALKQPWAPSSDGHFVGEQVRAHCREGEYSDLATLVGQPKHAAIKALFTKSFVGDAQYGIASLVIAYCFIFVFTLVANGMAMPYGLFVPHILSGACLGRVVGSLVERISGDPDVHRGIYAVVGAAGQLAGISRMTISLTMIMMEITMNMRLMLPLMLCIMVSKFVADRFTTSAFNVALELNKQIHMLVESDWNDDDIDLPIFDVCSQEVVVLHCTERAKDVARVLSMTNHHSFPLVEGARAHVCGVARRRELASAVSKASEDDLLDLRPFSDLTPEVKHWKTPASRVMTHFRVMGLTYLCIVDLDRGLMGIVTRSDISKISTPAGLKELRERAEIQREKAQASLFEEEALWSPGVHRRSFSNSSLDRSPRNSALGALGQFRRRSTSMPNVLDVQPAGGRRRSTSIDAGMGPGLMPGPAPMGRASTLPKPQHGGGRMRSASIDVSGMSGVLPGGAPLSPPGTARGRAPLTPQSMRRRSASMDASFAGKPLLPLEEQRPLNITELRQLSGPASYQLEVPGMGGGSPQNQQQQQQQGEQRQPEPVTLSVPAGMTPPLSSPALSADTASEAETSSEGALNDQKPETHTTREPSAEDEEQWDPSSNGSPGSDSAAAPPPASEAAEVTAAAPVAVPPPPASPRAAPQLHIEAVARRSGREEGEGRPPAATLPATAPVPVASEPVAEGPHAEVSHLGASAAAEGRPAAGSACEVASTSVPLAKGTSMPEDATSAPLPHERGSSAAPAPQSIPPPAANDCDVAREDESSAGRLQLAASSAAAGLEPAGATGVVGEPTSQEGTGNIKEEVQQEKEDAVDAPPAGARPAAPPEQVGPMAPEAAELDEGGPDQSESRLVAAVSAAVSEPAPQTADADEPPQVLPPRGPPPKQKRPFRRGGSRAKDLAEEEEEPQGSDGRSAPGTPRASSARGLPGTLPPLAAASHPSLRPQTNLTQQAQPQTAVQLQPPTTLEATGSSLRRRGLGPGRAGTDDGAADGMPVNGGEASEGADRADI